MDLFTFFNNAIVYAIFSQYDRLGVGDVMHIDRRQDSGADPLKHRSPVPLSGNPPTPNHSPFNALHTHQGGVDIDSVVCSHNPYSHLKSS